jgi:phage terminase Nu1 subunit (DNA packaging protein)
MERLEEKLSEREEQLAGALAALESAKADQTTRAEAEHTISRLQREVSGHVLVRVGRRVAMCVCVSV